MQAPFVWRWDMEENQRNSFLKEEYLHIQSVIHDYDDRALTIKAWSVTFSLAAICGAFGAHAPAVLLVASFSSILFWVVETIWKTTQYAFYNRSGKLERYFAGSTQEIHPLQIGGSLHAQFGKIKFGRFIKIFLWLRVALPHAVVALFGFVLYLLHIFKVISV